MLIHIKISDFGREVKAGNIDEKAIENGLNYTQGYDIMNAGLVACVYCNIDERGEKMIYFSC